MVPASSRASTDSLELGALSRLVERFGDCGEGLLERYDFGIDRASFRYHVSGLNDLLGHVRSRSVAFDPEGRISGIPDPRFWDNPGDLWNSAQAQRLAVGACLSSQRVRRSTKPENLESALVAKVAHNCLLGILDDLIDRENYTHLEAKNLYDLVLSSMLDPEFDSANYGRSLGNVVKPGQFQLIHQIESLTGCFNLLWNGTPRVVEYLGPMGKLNDRVALGQALTVYEKDAQYSPARLQTLAAKLRAPSGGLAWWERLAAHISPCSETNLLDIAFSQIRPSAATLERVLDGLYFVDAAITLLDHVATIETDLEAGIANLSLLVMRPNELRHRSKVRGYRIHLTNKDYVTHLRQIARLSARGLGVLDRAMHATDGYYHFLAVMMPVILLADWVGRRDDLIECYASELASSMNMPAFGREGVEERVLNNREQPILAR